MKFKKGNRWKSSKSELRYRTWRKNVFELNKRKRGLSKFYVCEKCNKKLKTTRALEAHHRKNAFPPIQNCAPLFPCSVRRCI